MMLCLLFDTYSMPCFSLKVGSSFLWSLRTIKKAIKQLSDTYADSQQLRHPTYDSWMDRFKAEMPYEDVQGYHLSYVGHALFKWEHSFTSDSL